jgi:RNA polymerase sigma-70 factor (ECF subfamily)
MLHEPGISAPQPSPPATGTFDDVVVLAYRDHYGPLHAYLRNATRDESVAEDLIQESFIRLLSEVRAGRTPDCIAAWLHRVASNLVISRGRRIATARRWMDRCGAERERANSTESPEQVFVRQERSAELRAVVASMPSVERTVLVLSGNGYSGAEIAEAIGRSAVATRAFLCRSRARTRERLAVADAPGS